MQQDNGLNPYQAPSADVEHEYDVVEYDDNGVFSFQGRIGRLRYWAYTIATILVSYLIFGVAVALLMPAMMESGGGEFDGMPIMFWVLYLAFIGVLLVTGIMWGVRRLHDLNQSGWLWLLNLVPIVNFFFGLYLLFAPGKEEPNQYGPPPPPNSIWNKIIGWGSLIAIPAIIGILAAVAIPAYQDYVERSQSFDGIEFEEGEMGDDAFDPSMFELEEDDSAAGAAVEGEAEAAVGISDDELLADPELEKLLSDIEAEVQENDAAGMYDNMTEEQAQEELNRLMKELEQMQEQPNQ